MSKDNVQQDGLNSRVLALEAILGVLFRTSYSNRLFPISALNGIFEESASYLKNLQLAGGNERTTTQDAIEAIKIVERFRANAVGNTE